ncbi:MAG TPA: hypothetical protein VMN39_00210, partial [Longimicrobiaceae bacterium]|nr:hypothetical protein [Longimicrobiaceae bacterium]
MPASCSDGRESEGGPRKTIFAAQTSEVVDARCRSRALLDAAATPHQQVEQEEEDDGADEGGE